MIDTSWEHEINPDNTPWKPGYRFCVTQRSKTVTPGGRMTPRRYYVYFHITRDGALEWAGGVKPTPLTLALLQAQYDRERAK